MTIIIYLLPFLIPILLLFFDVKFGIILTYVENFVEDLRKEDFSGSRFLIFVLVLESYCSVLSLRRTVAAKSMRDDKNNAFFSTIVARELNNAAFLT